MQKPGNATRVFLLFRISYKMDLFIFKLFRPQAGLALPFPIDEKEAKILSKRTLCRAF
jgi:hypothetical protein